MPARQSSAPIAGFSGFDLFLYATICFVWGTSWITIKFQLGTVAPEVSLVWRFILAGAIMMVFLAVTGRQIRFALKDHLWFAALGVTIFSTNFMLFYYGGLSVPSGLLSVVFSLASIINLTMGAIVLKQRPTLRLMIAGLMGAGGVFLMFWPQFASSGLGAAAIGGLLLCVGGTLSFCTGNMISARAQARGLKIFPATAWGMLYGAAFMALVAFVRGKAFIIDPTPIYLGSLVWLAVMASVVAFASYLTMLGRIGPARAGYATVIFPVIALAISTVVEGYQWQLLSVLGLALALIGNVLVLTSARPAAAVEEKAAT